MGTSTFPSILSRWRKQQSWQLNSGAIDEGKGARCELGSSNKVGILKDEMPELSFASPKRASERERDRRFSGRSLFRYFPGSVTGSTKNDIVEASYSHIVFLISAYTRYLFPFYRPPFIVLKLARISMGRDVREEFLLCFSLRKRIRMSNFDIIHSPFLNEDIKSSNRWQPSSEGSSGISCNISGLPCQKMDPGRYGLQQGWDSKRKHCLRDHILLSS